MQEYEPTDEEIMMHSKLSKKYLKKTGANVMEGDIGKAAKQIEENMGDLSLNEGGYESVKKALEKAALEQDDEDSDEDNVTGNMPLFSHELGKLRDKATGKKKKVKGAKKDKAAKEENVMEDDGDDDFESAEDDLPSQYSDSDQENEDYTIRKTDSLIVTATAEADHSNLEVYLYDHKTSDLYVHHEVILGAYPLCLEWMPSW